MEEGNKIEMKVFLCYNMKRIRSLGENMERVRQFGDAMSSIGICVVRCEDDLLLYFNQRIAKIQPNLCLGKRSKELLPEVFGVMHYEDVCNAGNTGVVRYVEDWKSYVKIAVDAYCWEDSIPAYIITVSPYMQLEDQKETERYSLMMRKAASMISEMVAYGNFTKGTFTRYKATEDVYAHIGVTEDLQESYIKFKKLIHPDERDEFEKTFAVEVLREKLKNGEAEVYGEFRKEENGRYHWISFRCIPAENPFDEDEVCLFIIRNINKRKQMERQLALQLNATYQSVPGGVVIIQMDENMGIVNASQSFYDMMGKSEEDYDKGYLEHILSEDRIHVQQKVGAMTQLGAPFDIVYRELDARHKIHWVQAKGTRISEEDGCPIYLLIRMDVTELKNAQQQLVEEQKQYRIYTEGIIDTLSNLVEFRDLDSGEHIKRTRNLTRILIYKVRERNSKVHLSDESIEKIADAAVLHDVGKIVISDNILNKPGKLTVDEFEEMKKHTVKGYEILKTLNLSQDEEQRQYSLDISRYHHERWDGNGYPDHLKGDHIPVWSQVVSIVDVYDALVSPRVYKKAYSHEMAMDMILKGECGSFNPELLECLKESVELLEQEYKDHV
jgi:PAS domain S-box-containing protein